MCNFPEFFFNYLPFFSVIISTLLEGEREFLHQLTYEAVVSRSVPRKDFADSLILLAL
jgi:hypothetical protein